MKKFLVIALALILALSLAACGGGSSTTPSSGSGTSAPPASSSAPTSSAPSSTPDNTPDSNTPAFVAGEWPDNEWTQQLPKPSAGTVGNVSTAGAENQTLSIKMDWTREEAAAYCDEITAAGLFDQNVLAYYQDSTPMDVLLEAENASGWEVGISVTEIRIIKP